MRGCPIDIERRLRLTDSCHRICISRGRIQWEVLALVRKVRQTSLLFPLWRIWFPQHRRQRKIGLLGDSRLIDNLQNLLFSQAACRVLQKWFLFKKTKISKIFEKRILPFINARVLEQSNIMDILWNCESSIFSNLHFIVNKKHTKLRYSHGVDDGAVKTNNVIHLSRKQVSCWISEYNLRGNIFISKSNSWLIDLLNDL